MLEEESMRKSIGAMFKKTGEYFKENSYPAELVP